MRRTHADYVKRRLLAISQPCDRLASSPSRGPRCRATSVPFQAQATNFTCTMVIVFSQVGNSGDGWYAAEQGYDYDEAGAILDKAAAILAALANGASYGLGLLIRHFFRGLV